MRTVIALALVAAVASQVEARPKKSARALVLLIDRSGSMQGPKLDAVKDAALAAVDALDVNDQVAIIAFDSLARVYVPLQRAGNREAIAKNVARLTSGGGTEFLSGLRSAFELLRASKRGTRHVILFSDGEAPSDGIAELVKEMRAARITISTIGVQGADRDLLSKIADQGGGRLYLVEKLEALSKVFAREVKALDP